MPSGVEQERYSTPVSSKHLANKENTLAKQDEVDPEGSSPPPLAAPLSDDTLDASAEKETANNHYHHQQKRSGISDIDSSPFAATPSPIGNRTLSNSEDPGNDETIDGTFDTDAGVGISRTLNISEIDETSFLNSNNAATNGESFVSSRRNSTSNDTTNNTLKSILELSEIDTTFDGAALNRTIGATDASTSVSANLSASAHRAPRDLSEIDITMDRTAGDTTRSGNANSIEESKLQAELAADASERMQRLLEEATTGGSSAGGDENSTLAGQAFVGGGGSGASVMTSSGSMASYSIGGNTAATAGTDIAEFLRKQNEAMQRALADAGAGVVGGGGGSGGNAKQGGEETIISPTKTRAVDAAVENARIMAEATAKLTPTGNDGKPTDDDQLSSPAVKRNSSMEFGSQSHLNVGATGKFTTDDTTGAVSVTVQSVKTGVSSDNAKASKSISKSTRKTKTAVSSSSTYQSQYALSPSQRAKESMTLAEKIRQAEAEAMARDGGPRFEKMSAVSGECLIFTLSSWFIQKEEDNNYFLTTSHPLHLILSCRDGRRLRSHCRFFVQFCQEEECPCCRGIV